MDFGGISCKIFLVKQFGTLIKSLKSMNTKESGRPKFHNLRLFLLSASALLLLTPSCKEGNRQTTESEGESGQTTEIPEVVKPEKALVERIDTCNLTIL